MTDIALQYDPVTRSFDIALGDNGDLVPENGLRTAVILSLFLDRRAANDDEIPDGSGDRRGSWMDAYPEVEGDLLGSRLYLLYRAKETQETLLRAKEYAEEALQWMLDDGVAKSVDVTADHVRPGVLGLLVDITQPDGGHYQELWEIELDK